MTSQLEATEALLGVFNTHWSGLGYDYQIYGERFDASSRSDPWAKVTIREVSAPQHTFGTPGSGRKFERVGLMIIQVNTLSMAGSERNAVKQGLVLGDGVRKIFEGQRVPGTNIHFRQVTAREAGLNGRWAVTSVEASFSYYETR